MKKVSYFVLLAVVYPMTVMGYTLTIADNEFRSRSYSVEEISRSVYNTAKSQNSSAPVFKTTEGGVDKYYKWTAPDLALYGTDWFYSPEEDVFVTTDQDKGSLSYLTVDNNGQVITNYAYYNVSPDAPIANQHMIHKTSDYGGAFYNSGTFSGFTGSFINNMAGSGGGIYNTGTFYGGDNGGIFYKNIVNSDARGFGGAIANVGNGATINSITGDFVENVVNAKSAYGGAVYNSGTIGLVTGDFIGNVVNFIGTFTRWDDGVYGGAIYNKGTVSSMSGNFVGNVINGYGSGGAIYNNGGTIDSIAGNFSNNRAISDNMESGSTVGGAISNYGTINYITSDFNDNYASHGAGAIYNGGTIGAIDANFYNNVASTGIQPRGSDGGAISNGGNIGSISGDFVGNSCNFHGGAIANYGTINSITGNFINNDVKLDGQPNYFTYGGAIANFGTMNSINADFTNNSAFLQGGAIANYGTINSLSGNFSGNNIRGRDNGTGVNSTRIVNGGGAIFNTGTIKLAGTVNFATSSDTIYNDGTILTINGTYESPMTLHLPSVTGEGTFSLTGFTNAYLDNHKIFRQEELNISVCSTLTAGADSLRYVRTLNNDGKIYLTDGILDIGLTNGAGDVVIIGNVTNYKFYPNTINIADGARLTTNANLTNGGDISNDGVLYISGGTLRNNVYGTGQTIIGNNAILYSSSVKNVDMNGVWNVDTNTVHAQNANINGYVNMTITDIAKDSTEYTGGKIIADSVTFNNNNQAIIVVHEHNLAKGESTGDLTLIDAGDWIGDVNLKHNNRYNITFDEMNHTFQITLIKTFEEFLEENSNSVNVLAIANAWNNLNIHDNTVVQQMQDLLDISSQYDLVEYLRILTNAAPNDSEVISETSRTVNSAIENQVAMRLASVGRSGGDNPRGVSVWGQLLLNHSVQSGAGSFIGNTMGFTIGADKKFNDNLRLGLGYTFNDTTAKSGDRNIDAVGHTIFTYGEYRLSPTKVVDENGVNKKISNPWHVGGALSYGMTSYDERAKYNISSEYDTVTIGLNGKLGYDITDTVDLSVGARYLNISQKDYVDSLYQKISVKDNNIFTVNVGAKYLSNGTWFVPTAHLDISYDIVSSDRVALVSTQSSSYRITGNHINPFSIQTGCGFDMNLSDWKLSLNYDLEWRPEFISHTGRIKVKYTF